MDLIKLKESMEEAERFLRKARLLLDQQDANATFSYHCLKEQGAVRRASLDLTRVLSELRNKD